MKQEQTTKSIYTIGQVSERVSIKEHVLRFWEREFDDLAPQKSAKGRRRYTEKDIAIINKIKDLLYKKQFTIAGAKHELKKRTNPDQHLPSNQQEHIIQELQEILNLL